MRTHLALQPLEDRACPATLVNARTVTYQDADGDNVAVVFSKPLLNITNVNTLFTFDTGPVTGNATKQQLRQLDLTSLGASANGVNITTTATRSVANGGDGLAALGVLKATGMDLGIVKIDGDLATLKAGDANTATSGLKTLTVDSLGRSLFSTGATFPDLHTVVQGKIGTLTIKRDLFAADIDVQGGADGQIGTVTIGGSLVALDLAASARIQTSGNVGSINIGGNLEGNRFADTARIAVGGKIGTLTVGGSLVGGSEERSGSIATGTGIGTALIKGSLIGANGSRSGSLASSGPIGNLKILGSLFGGAGASSGALEADSYGTVAVTGSVVGGSASLAGSIATLNNVGRIKIGGSLIGGTGTLSGAIGSGAGNIGSITIGGDLVGGKAIGTIDLAQAGLISAKRVGTMTIGGSLIAGVNETSGAFTLNGAIVVNDDIGTLTIKGNISGNGNNPALIVARGQAVPTATTDLAIGKINVQGRVDFATILAGFDRLTLAPLNADAQIGSIVVGGSWSGSSVSAGVSPTTQFFGDGDDAKLTGVGVKDEVGLRSRIGRFSVKGSVVGTGVDIGDHYGLVAEGIGLVSVAGLPFATQAGVSNDDFILGVTGDFRVREV